MIVGNGDISKALRDGGLDRPDVMFFARGVSNSGETNIAPFKREQVILSLQEENTHIVYFSSLCIYYSNTVYARHKRNMERLIKNEFNSYTIVRLGNIDWGNNPNTIINHFILEHAAGRTPELQDTYRYLLTKGEFIHWMKMLPTNFNNEMNIPGEMVHVSEIWKRVTDGKY